MINSHIHPPTQVAPCTKPLSFHASIGFGGDDGSRLHCSWFLNSEIFFLKIIAGIWKENAGIL
jgi:hypothetical protein